MGGVDRADKRVMTYSTARKCLRWYIKLIFHAVDVPIVDANVLFNLVTIQKVDASRIADTQIHNARTPDEVEPLEACPSHKQIPKHKFMRAIVSESIHPLFKALKDTHRAKRNIKPWSKLSQSEKRNPNHSSCWVPHLDNKQVRLTRKNLPQQHRSTPDKRIKHGTFIKTKSKK